MYCDCERCFWSPLIVAIVAAIFLSWFLFGKSLNKNRGIPLIPTTILDNNTTSVFAADLLGQYDVFLSFCGKDTRHSFTDFLYFYLEGAGIHIFRDDNEILNGEEIGPELLKAIKESKILIPIFSKNYASSKWCLFELTQMVECQAYGGKMIFPIFYDVHPYDVRHQRGSYEEAFRQHNKDGCNKKTIQRWKEALTKVGQLKRLELEEKCGRREGELVKIIAEKVLNFLKKNYNHGSEDLVGMDNHMKKMKGLLNSDFNGVRFIGIHGMGGLGKTTIAKTIYNQLCELFECHCFLEDVREISRSRNGIVHLQNQLLSKILKTKIFRIDGEFEGINKIKDTAHGKKVFIVLDDVDEKSQIDKLAGSYRWFGAQSRIIITTRNEEVLRALEQTCRREGHPEVYRSYKPELMDHDHSLILFSKYAFMSGSPPKGYDILSNKIVSTAAGLPLVLVTIGSSLFGEKDKDLWEEKLRKLKEIPHKEVLEILRLSFDPLDNGQKQIFLDIACFFIGVDKRNPCYMWDDCKFYPRDGLNVLVRRSLITIGDDNTLSMHDQLRDLGRQIVCEGNSNEPGRWSRLWRKDEALAMFKTCQGTKNVQAIRLDVLDFPEPWDRACLVGQDFLKLPNLRYLALGHADLDGDFEYLLSNLRWLKWRGCSSNSTPKNFHMRNLVILEMSFSKLKDDWEGWSQIKMSKKLKVLKLSCCDLLSMAPYISTFRTLERLEVCYCYSLCSLDGIKELESLRCLNASGCESLERLPNLSNLRKLEELYVWNCVKLIEIQGLDKLESLKYLDMSLCISMERLPNLSNLKKLKTLDAAWCRKLIKIQGLEGLCSLKYLDITHCESLERLPNLSNLKRLRELKTQSCLNLIEIHGLEGLESLEHLDMLECTSIKRLPNLSNLVSLKRLDISFCDALIEIHGLDRLESLEHLNMSNCATIGRLPDLPNFGVLKCIDLSNCYNLHEVEGIRVVESLESLDLSYCKALGKILDLRKLKNLKKLDIRFLEELNEIRGFEELKSLESLSICGCKSIKILPDFSKLEKLKELDVTDLMKLTESRGCEESESLTKLHICGCKSLKNIPYLPTTTI